jgi:hypothetical protein
MAAPLKRTNHSALIRDVLLSAFYAALGLL